MKPVSTDTLVAGAALVLVGLLLFAGARALAGSSGDDLGSGEGSARQSGVIGCSFVGVIAVLVGLWLVWASYSETWGR